MKKLFVLLGLISALCLTSTGFAFDQTALDRLYAGEKNLAGADFSGASIYVPPGQQSYVYMDVNFIGANFSNAYLFGRLFQTCDFSKANFTGANIGNVQFKTCKFNGVNFTNIRGPRVLFFNFIDKLENTNFTGANLTEAIITNAQMKTVRFINADLTRTSFNLGSIEATKFDNAVFNQTKFTQTQIPSSMKSFLTSQNIVDNGIVWTGVKPSIKQTSTIKTLKPALPKGITKGAVTK
ncbi:MAG: pentapeptide repeat-containing protein [Pseudomonadota bacterium]